MRYLKITEGLNFGDIFRQEKYGYSNSDKTMPWVAMGFSILKVGALAVQHGDPTTSYIPIEDDDKVASLLAELIQDADIFDAGTFEIVEDNRAQWLVDKAAANQA